MSVTRVPGKPAIAPVYKTTTELVEVGVPAVPAKVVIEITETQWANLNAFLGCNVDGYFQAATGLRATTSAVGSGAHLSKVYHPDGKVYTGTKLVVSWK